MFPASERDPLEKLIATLADDVREEPGGAVVLVGQAEDSHGASLGKKVGRRDVLFATARGRSGR